MKKKDLIQFVVGLSYNTGYEQAKKDAETEARHKRQVDLAYRKGRVHEAAQTDTRRAADLMGGAE